MSQTIEIIVDPAGNSRVETRGFSGPGCREASRFLEQALGQKSSERLTAEFHQEQPTERQVEQSP